MPTDQPNRLPSPTEALKSRPQGLADQLRWVHDMLRRDLGTVQRLVVSVSDGAPAEQVQAGLRELQSSGPLFQLRLNCLSYCATVHSHHRNEDDVLFPAVRRAAPHLARTVDRLEADHRIVASLLDQVEQRAHDLAADSARRSLSAALSDLATHLLEHLEVEEAALEPILDAWSAWPDEAPSEIRERVGTTPQS